MTDAITLEEKLLNLKTGRYQLCGLAMDWLGVLQRTDEGKLLSRAELIKKSLDDILSGTVTEEEIAKAKDKNKNLPPLANDDTVVEK